MMSNHWDYQEMTAATLEKRIDKVNLNLIEKLEATSAYMKSMDAQAAHDLISTKEKIKKLEEEQRKQKIDIKLMKENTTRTDRELEGLNFHLDYSIEATWSNHEKLLARVEELERKIHGAEGTRKIEEAILDDPKVETEPQQALEEEGKIQTEFCNAVTHQEEAQPLHELEEGEIEEEVEEDEEDHAGEYIDEDEPIGEAEHSDHEQEEPTKKKMDLMKVLEFRKLVREIPFHIDFEEACTRYSLRTFFAESDETEEEIRDCFERARYSFIPSNGLGASLLKNRWYPRWISCERLGEFNREVQSLPEGTTFAKAWFDYHIDRFFYESCEVMSEIKEYYEQAQKFMMPSKTLYKVEDPGRFLISIKIRGIKFKEIICDSGSGINLMSEEVAKRLGIKQVERSSLRIGLADASFAMPIGMIRDLPIRIGECIVPVDFQIVTMKRKDISQIILGGSFLATAGALMDWPNRRISLTNIDKDVFYQATPFVPLIYPIRPAEGDDEADATPSRDQHEEAIRAPPKRICLRTNSPLNQA